MISIAMATYNGEKYIRQQIDSILSQDYDNFELVICDDCSSDLTREILIEYSNKDARVHIYYNDKNLGFRKNFEKSIKLCNGDYIALSDQDDIWDKSHLSKLVSKIGDNYLVCGDALCFEESKGISYNEYLLSDLETNLYLIKDSLSNIKRVLYKGNPYQGASMLFSKKFTDVALPIPDDIPFHDVWFALVASCYNSFTYTNDVVTNYRQHVASVTKRSQKNLLTKIFNFPRYNVNLKDRYFYSKNLERLTNPDKSISVETIELLSNTTRFFSKINNRLTRFQYYPFYIRNIFYYLYGETSLSNRFSRVIQFLFF